jgi:tagaturonate reductase
MSYPRLGKGLVLSTAFQKRTDVGVPGLEAFDLPEKVLQFGSGAFLRAFADFFIDTANRQGMFQGRVVVVQSTEGPRGNILNEQDGLYTVCVQGLEKGAPVESYSILSSINRTLSAKAAWPDVLACAKNPNLQIIISNTTEVGIVLDESDALDLNPPRSFPGKLTAFLYERYKAFAGARDKGFIIIPCELLENNGAVLRRIVRQLAERWKLGADFLGWLETANRFCSSLVDRIVPGTPADGELKRLWEKLGYEDQLLIMAEVYSLWAIEGDDELKRRLAFAEANPTVLVAGDITPYRELKIRILNGTHTITTPVAFLLGNQTVLENMRHPLVSRFIDRVMRDEIGPSLDVDPDSVTAFIDAVLDRFRNPFLKHQLISITLQSTSKMRLRVVPSIKRYYEKKRQPPRHLCFGFAGYLLFMRGVEKKDGKVYGRRAQELYPINDDMADYFYEQWQGLCVDDEKAVLEFVNRICRDEQLWGMNLAALPDFSNIVAEYLMVALCQGVEPALRTHDTAT